MTLQDAVHSLRRYARALTLSSALADAYVREALDVLLDEADGVSASSLRLRLFAVFHQIWPGEEAGYEHAAETACAFDGPLRALDTECRAALLLVDMESFPLREAALIMGAPVAKMERWLLAARRELDPSSASVRIDAHWMDSSSLADAMDELDLDEAQDLNLSLPLHARGRMVQPLRVRTDRFVSRLH